MKSVSNTIITIIFVLLIVLMFINTVNPDILPFNISVTFFNVSLLILVLVMYWINKRNSDKNDE